MFFHVLERKGYINNVQSCVKSWSVSLFECIKLDSLFLLGVSAFCFRIPFTMHLIGGRLEKNEYDYP